MKVHNLTAGKNFKLEGLNPCYHTTREQGDISNICVFGFFSWVMYRDQKQVFPNDKWWLGICLGPSDNHGNCMSQWVISPTGQPVPRRTVRKLSDQETLSPQIEQWKQEMLITVQRKFGPSLPLNKVPNSIKREYLSLIHI